MPKCIRGGTCPYLTVGAPIERVAASPNESLDDLRQGRTAVNLRSTVPFAIGGVGLAIAASLFAPGIGVWSADHLDPPARTDPAVDSTPDRPADIADLYAWHTASSVILALTFAGPQATNLPATYDRNVDYAINISNQAPRTTTDIPIHIRFGQAGTNQNGVQVTGLPGVTGAISGPVETNLTKDGVMVRAGLFDDPFFFDLQGFRDTRNTGTLMFNRNRDFFAGQNLTAVVIEIPRDRIDRGALVDIWSATSRFGGQL
jgi:hypothetical protein